VTLPSLGFVTWNGRYPGTGDGQMARDLAGDAFGVLRPALNALSLRRRPIVAHQFFERCEKSSNGDVSRCRVVWRTSFRHLAFVHRPCARWKPPRRRTTAESAPRATCRDGPNRPRGARRRRRGRRPGGGRSRRRAGAVRAPWYRPVRAWASATYAPPDANRARFLITRVPADLAVPALGARRRMDQPRPRRGRRRARQRNRQPRKDRHRQLHPHEYGQHRTQQVRRRGPQLLVQEPGRVDTGRCGQRVVLLSDCRRSPRRSRGDRPTRLRHTPHQSLPHTTLLDATSRVSGTHTR
jgi:hypothetical protein